MKTKQIISVFILLLMVVAPLSAAKKQKTNRETVVFCIDEMDCHSCKTKIEKNIAFERGVKALDVDLDQKTVSVTYDTRRNNVENLQQAFHTIGYDATLPSKPACKSSCAHKKDAEKACEDEHMR